MMHRKRSQDTKQVGVQDDLIEKVKRFAHRITQAERAEANLQMFGRMGLDINDVERMATAVHLELRTSASCRSPADTTRIRWRHISSASVVTD